MSGKNAFLKSLRRIARMSVEADERIPADMKKLAEKRLYKYLRKQFEQARKDNAKRN